MIYVIGRGSVEGLDQLCQSIGAMRVRKFDGLNFWVSRQHLQLNPGDVVIPWGQSIPEIDQVKVLNGSNLKQGNELDLFFQLRGCHKINTAVVSPFTDRGRLPRKFKHVHGNDLINPPSVPDYYMAKYDFKEEYSVHIFSGKSLLAGTKVPVEGFCLRTSKGYPCQTCDPTTEFIADGPAHGPHPWIRVPEMGWKTDYIQKPRAVVVSSATTAVNHLNYLFAKVDIGVTQDDNLIVFGVSPTPQLTPQVLYNYSKALNGYISHKVIEPSSQNKPKDDGLL